MNTRFSEVNEYFDLLSQDKSEHTIRSYRIAINSMIEWFGIENINDISSLTPKLMREYRQHLLDEGLSVSSANSRIRPLSAFFNFLLDNEYIFKNPLERVKYLKEEKKAIFYLTDEEQIAMLNSCDNIFDKTLLLFMIRTGVRRDELVNLKKSNIIGSHLKVYGKGKKERIVPIASDALAQLQEYLMSRKDNCEYLFVSSRGSHKITGESVRRHIEKIAIQSGIDPERAKMVHPHITRKTCGTNLIKSGADMATTAKILGHANSSITERVYADIVDEVLERAVRNMENVQLR